MASTQNESADNTLMANRQGSPKSPATQTQLSKKRKMSVATIVPSNGIYNLGDDSQVFSQYGLHDQPPLEEVDMDVPTLSSSLLLDELSQVEGGASEFSPRLHLPLLLHWIPQYWIL